MFSFVFLGEGAEISTLEYVAPYASYGYRLGMANLWLFQPVVVSVFASDYICLLYTSPSPRD